MDLLQFINHLQAKILKGGRTHGIGQGHKTSAGVTAPPLDAPDNAAVGYMNADMVDGIHAKENYHGKAAGTYRGLNADQVDGVDKSLGHVASSINFNTASGDKTKAAVTTTFSGIPKQNDRVSFDLIGPDGNSVGSGQADVLVADPALTDVTAAVKTAMEAVAAIKAVLDGGVVGTSGGAVTLTISDPGPRGNLYVLKITLTLAAQSTLAIDKPSPTDSLVGIYRLTGGGPEEGINADKVDDLHAREHYHKSDAISSQQVKEPPTSRGINADTLDSFHGREPYHGVYPDAGTGLNADTLDGVHKLFGHKKDLTTVPTAGVLKLILGDDGNPTISGGTGTKVKLELLGVDNKVLTNCSTEVTSQSVDPASAIDSLGDLLAAAINNNATPEQAPAISGGTGLTTYLTAVWASSPNRLTVTAKKVGERNQYTVRLTITDAAAPVNPFKLKIDDPELPYVGTLLVGSTVKPCLTVGLSGVNPILGIDADMLDGIHAKSGHFSQARDVEGQDISQGIHADLLDGLHARTASVTDGEEILSELDATTKVVKTNKPYLPVADGISKDGNNVPTYVPKNPNLDADTLDGVQSRKGITITNYSPNDVYTPVADGILDQGVAGNVGKSANPALDADTLDGKHAADIISTSVDGATPEAGTGITISNVPNSTRKKINVDFAGSGTSAHASKSDHNHDGTYATAGHNHDGTYSPVGHNHNADYVAASGGTSEYANYIKFDADNVSESKIRLYYLYRDSIDNINIELPGKALIGAVAHSFQTYIGSGFNADLVGDHEHHPGLLCGGSRVAVDVRVGSFNGQAQDARGRVLVFYAV